MPYDIINFYNPSNHVFSKNWGFATDCWHFYMFLAAFYCKKKRFCNGMMTCVYVFGGILCGLPKIPKNPAYTGYFEQVGIYVLTCCELGFLGRRHSMWGIKSISPCQFSQNLYTYEGFIAKTPVRVAARWTRHSTKAPQDFSILFAVHFEFFRKISFLGCTWNASTTKNSNL